MISDVRVLGLSYLSLWEPEFELLQSLRSVTGGIAAIYATWNDVCRPTGHQDSNRQHYVCAINVSLYFVSPALRPTHTVCGSNVSQPFPGELSAS